MNFTIIIIRMTALSFRHSSYCPCTSERQWRRRAGEPQSRGSLSINVCWEIRKIVARRVRQIELIFLHLLFFAYPNCLVLRVVSVFVHDQTDNRHRLEVNWLEFIWRHLKTIPRPLVWAKDFKCAPPRCDEEWSRHPKSALSPLILLQQCLCKHQWLCQSGLHNHYTPFLLLWSSSSVIVKLRDQHQDWLQSAGVYLCTMFRPVVVLLLTITHWQSIWSATQICIPSFSRLFMCPFRGLLRRHCRARSNRRGKPCNQK